MNNLQIKIADARMQSIMFPDLSSLKEMPYFSSPNLVNKMDMHIKVLLSYFWLIA